MFKCTRCGESFTQKINWKHKLQCHNMPRPENLANEFTQDHTLTVKILAKKYKSTPQYIRYRLALGGIEEDFIRGRHNSIRSKLHHPKNHNPKSYITQNIPANKKQCSCGILIPLQDRQCVYCDLSSQGIDNIYQLVGIMPRRTTK